MRREHSSFTQKVSVRESVGCRAVGWLMAGRPPSSIAITHSSPNRFPHKQNCDPSSHDRTVEETNCGACLFFSDSVLCILCHWKNPFWLANTWFMRKGFCRVTLATRQALLCFLCVMCAAFICSIQRWWRFEKDLSFSNVNLYHFKLSSSLFNHILPCFFLCVC